MSDYTPTTEEIREYIETGGEPRPWVELDDAERSREQARAAAFDRWLAAHDAEKRAEWEAEQGWEYGFTSNWGTFAAHDRISAEQQAATVRNEIEAGRSTGDLKYHGRVMKRTKAQAGPWVPVEQEPAPAPPTREEPNNA